MGNVKTLEFPDLEKIRVLVYPDGKMYIAQCLEVDVACQASSMTQLKERLNRSLIGQVVFEQEDGVSPAKQAPDRFFTEFEIATPVSLDFPVGYINGGVRVKIPELEIRFK